MCRTGWNIIRMGCNIMNMMIPVRIKNWFEFQERPTLFLLGLTFSSSVVEYVLSVLVIYLHDVKEKSLQAAVIIINLQDGAACIMQIFMAFLRDAYIGHYWMAIISSTIYCIGLVLLSKLHIYTAIIVIALGTAGQKISFEAMRDDKVGDIMKPDDESQTRPIRCGCCNFKVHKRERPYQRCFIRSLFIMFSIAGAATGVYGLYYWQNQFSTSAYILAVGTFIFSLGFPFYGNDFVKPRPKGLTISNPLRVFVAAMFKRNLRLSDPQNDSRLYYGHTDQETQGHQQRVMLTPCLCFLNKAAIKGPSNHDPSVEVGRWRLCSVKEVEDAKRLLVWIPMSATFVLYGMIYANADTFFIDQAGTMNNSVGDIKNFPPATFYLISELTEWISKYLYKRLFRSFNSTEKKYLNSLKSIGLGLLTACCCFIVAALIVPKTSKSVSMFWLTPLFLLMGIMEGFARSGMEDFLYYQFPSSMRGYAVAFADIVIGLGKLLNIGFLAILGSTSFGNSWFETHMDYFYYLLAALGMVNFLVYVFLATRKSYRKAEITEVEEERGPSRELSFIEAFFTLDFRH